MSCAVTVADVVGSGVVSIDADTCAARAVVDDAALVDTTATSSVGVESSDVESVGLVGDLLPSTLSECAVTATMAVKATPKTESFMSRGLGTPTRFHVAFDARHRLRRMDGHNVVQRVGSRSRLLLVGAVITGQHECAATTTQQDRRTPRGSGRLIERSTTSDGTDFVDKSS
jgi:hypothetical protein